MEFCTPNSYKWTALRVHSTVHVVDKIFVQYSFPVKLYQMFTVLKINFMS